MTESYKCDKCKEFITGKPETTISYKYGSGFDLCFFCYMKLAKWLKKK